MKLLRLINTLWMLCFLFEHIICRTPVYQIRDLCDDDKFDTQANDWSFTGLVGESKTSMCDKKLIGGYNTIKGYGTMTKTYSNLPAHKYVYVTLSVWRIDSWEETDGFSVVVDETSTDKIGHKLFEDAILRCGNEAYGDYGEMKVMFRKKHSSDSIKIEIKGYLDEEPTNESFGVRCVQILFERDSDNTQELIRGYTQANPPNGITLATSYPNFETRDTCHESCLECIGSSATNCSTCKFEDGYFYNGTHCDSCLYYCKTCETANECLTFLCDSSNIAYWDRSCSTSCEFPLTMTRISDHKVCSYPCKDEEYLLFNGECLPTCYPMINETLKGKNMCTYPCRDAEYLFPDQTCKPSCESPLVPEIKYEKKFCLYKCKESETLYSNGTCSSKSVCDPFFISRIDYGRKFCDYPCSADQALAWNGSCLNSCEFPFIQRNQSGEIFCDFPCRNNEFLFKNTSCRSSCEFPLVSRKDSAGKKYCDYPCTGGETLNWDGSCISLESCASPLLHKVIDKDSYCVTPCTSEEFFDKNSQKCISFCPANTFPETNGMRSCQECNQACLKCEESESEDKGLIAVLAISGILNVASVVGAINLCAKCLKGLGDKRLRSPTEKETPKLDQSSDQVLKQESFNQPNPSLNQSRAMSFSDPFPEEDGIGYAETVLRLSSIHHSKQEGFIYSGSATSDAVEMGFNEEPNPADFNDGNRVTLVHDSKVSFRKMNNVENNATQDTDKIELKPIQNQNDMSLSLDIQEENGLSTIHSRSIRVLLDKT